MHIYFSKSRLGGPPECVIIICIRRQARAVNCAKKPILRRYEYNNNNFEIYKTYIYLHNKIYSRYTTRARPFDAGLNRGTARINLPTTTTTIVFSFSFATTSSCAHCVYYCYLFIVIIVIVAYYYYYFFLLFITVFTLSFFGWSEGKGPLVSWGYVKIYRGLRVTAGRVFLFAFVRFRSPPPPKTIRLIPIISHGSTRVHNNVIYS